MRLKELTHIGGDLKEEKPNKIFDFFNKNSKKISLLLISLGLILGVLSSFLLMYLNSLNPSIVASVNGKNITREDLNKALYARNFSGTLSNPTNVSLAVKKVATDELIEAEIAKQNATKLGISFSEHDIASAVASHVAKEQYDKMTADQRAAVKYSWENNLYAQAVKDKLLGWREGEYLLFRFDKYVDYKDGKNISGAGDQKLINDQKTYSKGLADSLSTKLQAGQISFDQAKASLEGDSKANALAFSPRRVNIEGVFDKNDFLEERSFFDTSVYQGLKDGVAKVKEGGYRSPITLKANIEGQYVDFAYAVVKVDKAGTGTNFSYNEWINNQKKELNVVNNYNSETFLTKSMDVIKKIFGLIARACSVTFSGTEKTNLQIITVYRGTDGLDHPFANVPMTIHAGSSSTNNGLSKYNSSCSGVYNGYSTNKTTDSNGKIYLNNSTGGNPAVINCDHTSAATFQLPANPPAISGAVGGYWEVDLSTSTYKQWFAGTGNYGRDVKLNLGSSTSWANGTEVVKRVRWVPNFVTPKFTTEVWFYNYRLNDFVNYGQPGDTMGLELYVTPQENLGDIWIRDNINNNSNPDVFGTGTATDPYSIRQVSSSICITTACGAQQNAGNYDVNDAGNKLQWASHSVYPGAVQVGDYYQVDVIFTIRNDSSLIGTYVQNGEHAWSSAYRDSNTANWIGGVYANGQLSIVPPEVTLSVGISPSGAGRVIGGLGDIDGDGIDCPGVNCSTSFYKDYPADRAVTDLTAVANTNYTFSNWSGNCSGTNTFSGAITMDSSKTCTANFNYTPPPATLSCTSVTPGVGETPLAIRVTFISNNGLRSDLTNVSVSPGDGTSLPNSTSPVVYTFKNEGTFYPTVSSPSVAGGAPQPCTPSSVTVINPSNPSGGEKPPGN